VIDCSSFSNSSVRDRFRCGAMLWRDIAALVSVAVLFSLLLLSTRTQHYRWVGVG
jgi:hypothetical protein